MLLQSLPLLLALSAYDCIDALAGPRAGTATMKGGARSRRGGAKRGCAAGFGAAEKPPVAPSRTAALDEDGARFLADAGGALDQAQSRMLESKLAQLRSTDPNLVKEMSESVMSQRAREKLVELTWDVVATFMPPGEEPPPPLAARLRRIACAARPESGSMLLDIGCGNGVLLPALLDAGCLPADYCGCDLSGRMIAAAEAAHGASGATFVRSGFFEDDVDRLAPPGRCRAVVFSGSLQFFDDVEATLRRAAALLAPGGRIVVAHVNGAAFVADERRGNPATVRSLMPSLPELEALATRVGAGPGGTRLRVLPPAELGSTRALDAFYLVALESVID